MDLIGVSPLWIFIFLLFWVYNAENYKYLYELLEALVPLERSSTICGWNNRGQLLWDYLKIVGEVDTLLANQDLAAGYQLEKLRPQLSGLCARINMLPCPTAMDRCVASVYVRIENFC
jgi:hypothetical protein